MTMLNIRSWNAAERDALRKRGARHLVVVRYTRRADERQGDVVSWHRTYDAAARAVGPSEYLSIEDIDYTTGSDF